ncbi:unnamed protein product, partial [Laminaria digitata]
MAEAQEAQMRKVEELSALVEAQSAKTEAQSAQATEQAAKLAALQGITELARTTERRPSSPGPDVRQGAYSVAASRHKVPMFHGEASEYPMWRKKLLSHIFMFYCGEAVAPRAVPILVGDEGVLPSELKQRHTDTEIADATLMAPPRPPPRPILCSLYRSPGKNIVQS